MRRRLATDEATRRGSSARSHEIISRSRRVLTEAGSSLLAPVSFVHWQQQVAGCLERAAALPTEIKSLGLVAYSSVRRRLRCCYLRVLLHASPESVALVKGRCVLWQICNSEAVSMPADAGYKCDFRTGSNANVPLPSSVRRRFVALKDAQAGLSGKLAPMIAGIFT